MKQLLLTKTQTVQIEQNTNLKSVLLAKMNELGLDTSDLIMTARHLLFSVAGKILPVPFVDGQHDFGKLLETEVSAGQTVRLLPAYKAG